MVRGNLDLILSGLNKGPNGVLPEPMDQIDRVLRGGRAQ